MSEPKTIQGYLDCVAEQIRWKRARPIVTAELKQHLEDQRDAFIAQGQEDPEALAVEEMGDPTAVGLELDSIHRPKPQWGLLALTALLAVAGAVLRVQLTADWARDYLDVDPGTTALALLLGAGALLAGYFLHSAALVRHAVKIYIGSLILGVLLILVSPEVNQVPYYARYVPLCYPVVYALWLYTCRGRKWRGLVRAVLGGIPLAAVCVAIPYFFGLVLLLLTGFFLLLAAAWNDWFALGRWKSVAIPVACAAALTDAAARTICRGGLGAGRLAAALHPELDPMGAGYQGMAIQSAVQGAQWLGEGIWSAGPLADTPFERAVPGCESDAFLTTVICKLGWLPFLAVVLVCLALLAWMLCRGLKQKSQLGKLLVLAVVLTLGLQALFSVIWNMGCTLVGASFPLVMGNLNTVVDLGLIGLALGVFRGACIARDTAWNELPLPRYRVKIALEKVQ